MKARQDNLNQSRSKAQSFRRGQRVDALFYRHRRHTRIELGASECSPVFSDTSHTKWLSDTDKLAQLMRDFIVGINRHTDGNEEVLRNVVVFGIVCAGMYSYIYKFYFSGFWLVNTPM